MFGALPYKTKQFFFVLIKLSIVIGAFYFIYHKLTSNKELYFDEFLQVLNKNEQFNLKNCMILVFLSMINWLFEIFKWQYLMSHVKKISFYSALEQSLGSLTASLFTPNRVGEYGVKVMYYSRNDSKKIIAINILSNSLQMAITMILGLIGISFFLYYYTLDFDYYKVLKYITIIIIIVAFPVIGLYKTEFSIKGISFKNAKQFYSKIKTKNYIIGFILSLLRYIIFSFQFYFLLKLFRVDLDYFHAMTGISTMYFLASIVPTLSLFDVVLKGSVAVFIFSIIGINSILILSVVTIMWVLNFVLPSLIGAVFILKFKLPKLE